MVGSKKSIVFFYNTIFYSIQNSRASQGRSLKMVIMSEIYDMNELRNEDYEDYDWSTNDLTSLRLEGVIWEFIPENRSFRGKVVWMKLYSNICKIEEMRMI